jgi:chromatin segregation and condensation protein Rec8/ScpA/Scc1 (kleisin family)
MHPRIIPVMVVTVALLATSSPPVVAQTSSKDVAEKASETGEAIKAYTVEKKNEAVAHAKKITADLDAKIKDLVAQASRQTGEAKAKAQAEIKELKAKQVKASQKATELSKATKASWDRAKEGFVLAYHDLVTAYDKAAAEFKK